MSLALLALVAGTLFMWRSSAPASTGTESVEIEAIRAWSNPDLIVTAQGTIPRSWLTPDGEFAVALIAEQGSELTSEVVRALYPSMQDTDVPFVINIDTTGNFVDGFASCDGMLQVKISSITNPELTATQTVVCDSPKREDEGR